MSSMSTLRAGIVGSGFSASFHYEALRRVYDVRVETDCRCVLSREIAAGGICRQVGGSSIWWHP